MHAHTNNAARHSRRAIAYCTFLQLFTSIKTRHGYSRKGRWQKEKADMSKVPRTRKYGKFKRSTCRQAYEVVGPCLQLELYLQWYLQWYLLYVCQCVRGGREGGCVHGGSCKRGNIFSWTAMQCRCALS